MNDVVNNEKKTPELSGGKGRGWFIAALVFSLIAIAIFAYYTALTITTVEAILKLEENVGGSEQFGAGLGAAIGFVLMLIFGGVELIFSIPATILSWVGVSRSEPPFKLCNTVLGIIDIVMIALTVIAFIAVALMI